MYKCECGCLYEQSKESSKLVCQPETVEHIIVCPDCKSNTHVIGAEYDIYAYGTVENPAYIMYGRDRKPSDINLQEVLGIKVTN